MNRLITIARFLTLSAAFVGVMAFAGAFLGAIGGMILVLLSYTVLGLGTGTLELLPPSMAIGLIVFMGLGIALMAPHAPRPIFHATPIAVSSESN